MLPKCLLMTLVTLTVLWAVVAAEIDVSANPETIDVGLSSALDVNCAVSISGTAVAGIMSILLLREPSSGGNKTELATINQFSPSKVNLVSNEGISADGFLDSAGQSYIHLHWDYPVAEQTGTYHCMADGMDQLGHMLSLNNVSVVSGNQPDIVGVMNKMKQMEQHLSEVDQELADVKQNLSDVTQKLSDATQNLLEANSIILGLETIMFEMPPLEYNDTHYLLSHVPFTNYNDSVNICKAIGGYLVVANDIDEYTAIMLYVANFFAQRVISVLIEGTDEGHEGEWVLPSSNLSLPLTDQALVQTANSDQNNCLTLMPGWYSYVMYPSPCYEMPFQNNSLEVRFMCEL